MPYFSDQSESRLKTCDEGLQHVCRTVIQHYDFKVIFGHRGEVEQNNILSVFSTKKYPDSKHNLMPSLAVDVAPYPIDWKDTDRFIHLAGMMLMAGFLLGIKLRWGGDWDRDTDMKDQTLMDFGHFELV